MKFALLFAFGSFLALVVLLGAALLQQQLEGGAIQTGGVFAGIGSVIGALIVALFHLRYQRR